MKEEYKFKLFLQGAQVQSQVWELRPHMLCGVAKKEKFRNPEAELVDCSTSLSQPHSPDNESIQLYLFQEAMSQVASKARPIRRKQVSFKKRHFYENQRKTTVSDWSKL